MKNTIIWLQSAVLVVLAAYHLRRQWMRHQKAVQWEKIKEQYGV